MAKKAVITCYAVINSADICFAHERLPKTISAIESRGGF